MASFEDVAPEMLPPSDKFAPLRLHWKVKGVGLIAPTMRLAVVPVTLVLLWGCEVMTGFAPG